MSSPVRPPLILASTSPYRRALLARLGIGFDCIAPRVDETARPGETPRRLALRLARAKAAAVSRRSPDAWVVGSDQVCACGARILGKPGDTSGAVDTLRRLSGRTAEFVTAVVVLQPERRPLQAIDVTQVRFRRLSLPEIRRYVAAEPALDCAGAFKSEGLGISLCASIETADPSALIGLPLIATRRLLARAGWSVP